MTDPSFFARWLSRVPGRVVELACHPGYYDVSLIGRDCGADDGLLQRRVDELKLLNSPSFDEAIEAAGFRRVTPYLYTPGDIEALMAATAKLRHPLRRATYRTLIGLLAVSGIRIGEAIHLNRDDLDWDAGLLVVRVAYSDGSEGTLDVSCHFVGTPDAVFEGVIASKGFVDYWNREEPPAPPGNANRTAFHVID